MFLFKQIKAFIKVLLKLMFTLFTVCNMQGQNSSHYSFKDSHPVKSCLIIVYEASINQGEIIKGIAAEDFKEQGKFDKKGNKTEESLFDSNNKIVQESVYQYSSNGNLETLTFKNEAKETKGKFVYIYNENGEKVKFKDYNEWDELISIEEYILNKAGKIIIEKAYYSDTALDFDTNDSIPYITTFKYNNLGYKTQKLNYNLEHDLDGKLTYKYHKNNLKAEIISYNYDNTISDKTVLSYDEFNNIVEILWYIKNPSLVEITTVFENGIEYTEESTWTTDDMTLEKKTTYSYKNDTKGNWIEKIEFENDIPLKIIERQIEYYNE